MGIFLLFIITIILGLALGFSTVISPVMTVLVLSPIFFGILYRQPLYGILIIAFMLPIDIFVSRGSGNSLVQYVGFLTFLAALLKTFIKKKDIRLPWLATSFIVIAWLASILNGFFGSKLITYLMLLCLYWLIQNYVQNARDIEKILIALITGALVSIPLGLVYEVGKVSFVSEYEVFRFGGGVKDPNDYAGLMVVCFGVLLGFITIKRNIISKIMSPILYSFMAIILLSIFMTYSRGGIIALVIVILAWLWCVGLRLRVFLLTGLISGIALRFTALLPGLNQRIASILTYSGGENRFDLWLRAVTKVIPHHLFLGVGIGQFTQALRDYAPGGRINVAHNMFLSVAVESGMIALVLFALTVLRPFITLLVRLKTLLKQESNNISVSVFLGTTGALISGQFLTWDYQKVLWLMIGLGDQICWLCSRQNSETILNGNLTSVIGSNKGQAPQ